MTRNLRSISIPMPPPVKPDGLRDDRKVVLPADADGVAGPARERAGLPDIKGLVDPLGVAGTEPGRRQPLGQQAPQRRQRGAQIRRQRPGAIQQQDGRRGTCQHPGQVGRRADRTGLVFPSSFTSFHRAPPAQPGRSPRPAYGMLVPAVMYTNGVHVGDWLCFSIAAGRDTVRSSRRKKNSDENDATHADGGNGGRSLGTCTPSRASTRP